jgi:hypothetical protein
MIDILPLYVPLNANLFDAAAAGVEAAVVGFAVADAVGLATGFFVE